MFGFPYPDEKNGLAYPTPTCPAAGGLTYGAGY